MATRKPYVGGNWKMNLDKAGAVALAEAVVKADPSSSVDVTVFPPLCYLDAVGSVLKDFGSSVKLGTQDFYHEPNGAYTGEVSVEMLKDLGVQSVLVGHSERRHVVGENDLLLNAKVQAALHGGLDVVLCVGEKHDQRDLHQTDAINAAQISYGLAGVPATFLPQVTIAYEPVWAIGTGNTASASDAQEAHAAIRKHLANIYSEDAAATVRIQYGGSVKPNNAGELFSQPDIDGGLIGGASLKADDFAAIVEAAAKNA